MQPARGGVSTDTRGCREFLKYLERSHRCHEQRGHEVRVRDNIERSRAMNTILMEQLNTGDVIEMTTADNEVITVLVLLATDDALVLDPCNDETPFVLRIEELTRVPQVRRRGDVRRRLNRGSGAVSDPQHLPERIPPLFRSGELPLAWAPCQTRRPRCFSGSAACRSSNASSTRSTPASPPTTCCSRSIPNSPT